MSNQLSAVLGGADKAALVLLALGSDRSAALLSGLKPEETARLSEHLSRLADIDGATRDRVLEEFRRAVARPEAAGSALAPTPPEEDVTEGRADRAAARAGRVRKLDLARLERVPPRAVASAHAEGRAAVELPQDLPVGCRAELAALSLPVGTLAELGVGDVLLLRPDSDTQVELVGGQGCRLPGTLREIDGRRAVEILGDVRTEEEADDPAASHSTPGE